MISSKKGASKLQHERKGYDQMKKFLALLLALLLCTSGALAEFPLTTTGESLHIMVNNSSLQPDFGQVKMWQRYAEMTGVHIEWENIPAGTATEKLNMAFGSEELPDVFLKFGISAANQIKFGSDEGYLVNLNENNLLETYAPNFYAYMKAHPTVEAALTMPDGAIYSLPQIIESVPNKVAAKMFINKTWLDKLGLDLPKTTKDLYDILVAFKNGDPNGNGLADEIPFGAPNFNYIYYSLIGAFGGGTRGVHDTVVDADPETGYPRILGTSDAWKHMLTYVHQLYAEELLDNAIFTMKSAQYTANAAEDKYGVIVYTNFSNIPESIAEHFVGIEEALEGPDGDKFWFPVRSDLHSIGNWVITTKCKNVPLALQFVDYFYSEEGVKLFNYGTQGDCHVVKEDGSLAFVDAVYESVASGISFDAAVAPYVTCGGNNPVIVMENYFYGGETKPVPAAAAHAMIEYFPEEIWPIFTYTAEESEEASVIRTDINNYVNTMRARFVTGEESLDKWDDYVHQINTMGADRLCEIVNNAYIRSQKFTAAQ